MVGPARLLCCLRCAYTLARAIAVAAAAAAAVAAAAAAVFVVEPCGGRSTGRRGGCCWGGCRGGNAVEEQVVVESSCEAKMERIVTTMPRSRRVYFEVWCVGIGERRKASLGRILGG
jgi:hypothetical protein